MEQKKKLLYVHGFGSSGSSGTVMALRRHLTGWKVIAPDLPVDPFEALELLRRTVAEEAPDIVVGTFEMSRSLLFGKMGRNKYMSKRKDGATEFRIDKAVVERFKLMEKEQFAGITDAEKKLVMGLFGDKDPVVHFRPLMAELYGEERCRWFAGEHRLNDEIVKKVLLPLVKELVGEKQY